MDVKTLRANPVDVWANSEREPRILVLLPQDVGLKPEPGQTRYSGVFDFEHLVQGMGVAVLRLSGQHDPEALVAMVKRGRRQVVINTFSAPDMHREALRVAAELCRNFPTINDPKIVLKHQRDSVSRLLQGIPGLYTPKCVRFKRASRPPIAGKTILRHSATSTGRTMLLVSNEAEAAHFVPAEENYATEFVDFASADGLYRKYRIRFVSGKPIPFHLLVDHTWNVHAEGARALMKGRADLISEEIRYLSDPLPAKHAKIFAELHRRIGVDHYGVDYSILPDGRILLFEANAAMKSWSPKWWDDFPALVPPTKRVVEEFAQLVARKASIRR